MPRNHNLPPADDDNSRKPTPDERVVDSDREKLDKFMSTFPMYAVGLEVLLDPTLAKEEFFAAAMTMNNATFNMSPEGEYQTISFSEILPGRRLAVKWFKSGKVTFEVSDSNQ